MLQLPELQHQWCTVFMTSSVGEAVAAAPACSPAHGGRRLTSKSKPFWEIKEEEKRSEKSWNASPRCARDPSSPAPPRTPSGKTPVGKTPSRSARMPSPGAYTPESLPSPDPPASALSDPRVPELRGEHRNRLFPSRSHYTVSTLYLKTLRGMSGGDVDEPTTTTPDDEALARVLQRSLEAKVATGEQQLQSDEQTALALQVYHRMTRCPGPTQAR